LDVNRHLEPHQISKKGAVTLPPEKREATAPGLKRTEAVITTSLLPPPGRRGSPYCHTREPGPCRRLGHKRAFYIDILDEKTGRGKTYLLKGRG